MQSNHTRVLALAFLCIGLLCGAVQADHFKIHTNVPRAEFPAELLAHADGQPLAAGYLDITAPPYNCDPKGQLDATEGLRRAIHDAYVSNLAVFLPGGTYLCSGELECFQTSIPGAGWSQRKFGHILIGDTRGKRPVLKLADRATLKDNVFVRYEWHGTQRGKPSTNPACHYLGTFRGIDIDMGRNPGMTAIENKGHQHCVIEDTHIYGDEFAVGIGSAPGCGGSTVNVQVTGGETGIRMNGYRPVPLFTGIVLRNQQRTGIQIGGNSSPITLVGFEISGGGADYRAIEMRNSHGGMNLIDGKIEATTAIWNQGQGALFAENVFVKAKAVLNTSLDDNTRHQLTGSPTQWHGYRIVSKSGKHAGYINQEGIEHGQAPEGLLTKTETAAAPPADLVSRHLWPETPSWQTAVPITAYGATPDDPSDDDAPAIQRAIDGNVGKAVLIPRGHFHVSQPIVLKPGTSLIGAAKNISVIHASPSWRPTSPCYILDSVDSPTGTAYLDNFALDNSRIGDELDGNRGHLRIRMPHTVVRDVQIVRQGSKGRFDTPSVVVEGNGGGRVYNLSNDDDASGDVTAQYHKLAVRDTTQPLTIYATSIEHQTSGRSQIGLLGAHETTVYGLKFESATVPLLALEDCTNVRLIGMYGNISAKGHASLIEIRDSTDLLFAGLTRNYARKQYVPEKFWISGTAGDIPGAGPVVLFSRR